MTDGGGWQSSDENKQEGTSALSKEDWSISDVFHEHGARWSTCDLELKHSNCPVLKKNLHLRVTLKLFVVTLQTRYIVKQIFTMEHH